MFSHQQLPCGHEFCKSCVAQLKQKGLAKTCPLCRKPLPPGQLNIVPKQIVGLSSYADKEWERPTSLVRRSAPGVLSLLALPTVGAVVWILTHRPSALSAPLHDGSPPRARFQTTQMPSPAPAASFHERRHVGEIVTSDSFETVTCTRPLACR